MKKLFRILLLLSFCGSLYTFAFAQEEGGVDAERIWKKNCRKCHDKDGSGATPAGKKLHVKDYTQAEVQAALTDDEIIMDIKEGVKDEAGETVMDAYPDFTEEELTALVALIRSFGPAAE